MKITKVSYSKLVTKPGEYSNIRFGAEADVQENETPQDATTSLVYWVNRRLQELGYDEQVRSELVEECGRLEDRKKELEEAVSKLHAAARQAHDAIIGAIPF